MFSKIFSAAEGGRGNDLNYVTIHLKGAVGQGAIFLCRGEYPILPQMVKCAKVVYGGGRMERPTLWPGR